MPPSLKEEPCAAAGSEPLQMQLDGSQRREAQLQQQVRVRPRHFTNISSRYQVSGPWSAQHGQPNSIPPWL